MNAAIIDWAYIILLVTGGVIGYGKTSSKISLGVPLLFAIPMILNRLNVLSYKWAVGKGNLDLMDILQLGLMLIFAVRLMRTKSFMPDGMTLIVTVVALALRHMI